MRVPLPQVISDVGPGGALATSMRGLNALQDAMLSNEIKGIEAQYAPVTTLSNALSKAAYANLMGPQYLAKLFNNPDFVSNLKPEELASMRQLVVGSGIGQSAFNNALLNAINHKQGNSGSLTNWLVDRFKNLVESDNQPISSSVNPFIQMETGLSENDRNAIKNMRPGDSHVIQGRGNDIGYLYDKNGNNVTYSPEEVKKMLNTKNPEFYETSSPLTGANQYYKQAGITAGLKEEEKELGSQRAKAIGELGKEYRQDVEAMIPLNRLAQISQSSVFMNMRKDIPFFQNLQLQTLSKIGNPQEQKIIGDFIVDTRSAIANTVNSFQGRAMAKEFDFANTMKVSDNDTLGVMLGKLESLMTFKKATMERNRIANNLIKNGHYDEGDAYEAANKQVDMDKIRSNIASQLQTPIKIRNKKTGETKLVSVEEYNKLLNQK